MIVFECKTFCKHYDTCYETCAMVNEASDGNVKRKENISNYPPTRAMADYNEELYKLMRSKSEHDEQMILKIRSMEDLRLKSIASMLYSCMSLEDIASVAHKLPTTRDGIFKIIKRHKREIIFGSAK